MRRDTFMFIVLQFVTHTPTDEALNYRMSALWWGFLHGFLNLWGAVCFDLLRKYKAFEEHEIKISVRQVIIQHMMYHVSTIPRAACRQVSQ